MSGGEQEEVVQAPWNRIVAVSWHDIVGVSLENVRIEAASALQHRKKNDTSSVPDASTCYVVDGKVYDMNDKPSNPKDVIGSNKVPLGLVPGTTMAYLAIGHLEGDLKYGRVNWREAGVRTMIYIDACLRHLAKFRDGEWDDPVTKVPHLANALACLSIIVDAYHSGKLVDDRPKSAPTAEVIEDLSKVVVSLKQLYGDKKPIDYYIDGPKQRE